MGSTWELLLASLCGMGKLFLLSAVGALAAKYPSENPVLPPEAQRSLARLITMVVIPAAIVFGLGSNITIDNLQNLSVLLAWSAVHTCISAAVAFIGFGLVPGLSPRLNRVLVGATSFHNAVALPLLMITSLCDQPALDDIPDCKVRGLASCFVYLLPWLILFWSVGFSLFSNSDDSPVELPQEDEWGVQADEKKTNNEVVLHDQEEEQVHGAALVPSQPAELTIAQRCARVFMQPCMLAIPVALVCGLVVPLRTVIFAQRSPLGSTLSVLNDCVLGISTMLMAAGLFADPGRADPEPASQRVRLVVVFCVLRLLIVPAIGITLFCLVKSVWPALVGDRVQQLVILIEFGSTSSQTAVVVCQAAGARKTSAILANLYLWQYSLAMITLTGVTAVALHISLS